VLDHAEYQALASDPHNQRCLFPYIGGDELNTSPTQSHHRYVINFGSMRLEEAEKWQSLLEIVRERVKPEREKAKDHGPGNHGKKYWWQHALRSDALYDSIKSLDRCLATAQVSKHLMFSFQPINRVFSYKAYIFPMRSFSAFAILQSRIHEPWTWLLSSTLGSTLNYSASDCFATFAFPQADPRSTFAEVEAAGEAVYQARAKLMVDTDQGLTKIYNALKDPESDDDRIFELRRFHEVMDRAVLKAYGWSDIEVPPYCPLNEEEEAAVEAFSDEIIDRLYLLNAERAAEEEGQGKYGRATKKSTSKQSKKDAGTTMTLPGMSDAEGAS